MILEYMQENKLLKTESSADNQKIISIVSHLEKSEMEKYGKDIRLYCFKI